MSDKKIFTIQAEEDLLVLFKACCKQNDQTQSQAVRQFMREYISKTKQPDIFSKSKNSKSGS